MTNNEINTAIAEACGWTVAKDADGGWRACDSEGGFTKWMTEVNARNIGWPQYTTDLNAMHEAEKVLKITLPDMPYDASQRTRYVNLLESMCGCKEMVMATAQQRAEAFLRTLGKWKD